MLVVAAFPPLEGKFRPLSCPRQGLIRGGKGRFRISEKRGVTIFIFGCLRLGLRSQMDADKRRFFDANGANFNKFFGKYILKRAGSGDRRSSLWEELPEPSAVKSSLMNCPASRLAAGGEGKTESGTMVHFGHGPDTGLRGA